MEVLQDEASNALKTRQAGGYCCLMCTTSPRHDSYGTALVRDESSSSRQLVSSYHRAVVFV